MRMSDIVASYISEMLDNCDGNAEIKRNELASLLGCVPSQINYVITSRFTPEQGYIVESRRGGGGYIKITRVSVDKNTFIMNIINGIGDSVDYSAAYNLVNTMVQRGIITAQNGAVIAAALSDRCYREISAKQRDSIRANILKNMLLNLT